MSLNFSYRVSNVYYFEDGDYLAFDLYVTRNGVRRVYPCSFRFTSPNVLRSALSRRNFGITVERNAHFVNAQALRNLELTTDLTAEFEAGYVGPVLHVYDFCKAFMEHQKKQGVYYTVAF